MDDRTRLLRELDEGRRLLLLAMADLEEEEGDSRRAKGWRWLAARDRWPLFVVRHEDEDALDIGFDGWEWWRAKSDANFCCSLPALLMEHVRKAAKTPKGQTCRFESASQALGCAATCAGLLIEADLLD